MAPRGRPKKADTDKKRNNVTVAFDDHLKGVIDEAAEDAGRSISGEIQHRLISYDLLLGSIDFLTGNPDARELCRIIGEAAVGLDSEGVSVSPQSLRLTLLQALFEAHEIEKDDIDALPITDREACTKVGFEIFERHFDNSRRFKLLMDRARKRIASLEDNPKTAWSREFSIEAAKDQLDTAVTKPGLTKDQIAEIDKLRARLEGIEK